MAEETEHRRVGIALDPNTSDYVFDWSLKNFTRAGDKVILMHCEDDPRQYAVAYAGMPVAPLLVETEATRKQQVKDTKEFLAPFIHKLNEAHIGHEAALLRGDARDALVDGTRELKVDTLIMGSRQLGAVKRALLGSVSTYCVHHCDCPVVVVRHPEHK
eukprot:CAMPEP_0175910544 /NCGR_PEP_ID=MMETSP0108-20121206/7726_1 /TAXON_ID=195067 ORGANISM="Goniomonas pacifica, Strain CCMP1869" /NCGR_SAMPLE_ID=MMETSP0108 /ASSEMBLY_ACC=CAM_ASM_000204 /LENGTH=158 /DNA_ID=CAMNT_0017232749 /DNA_START=6 /DNA_END=482 /DNA_ORIENTATION=+